MLHVQQHSSPQFRAHGGIALPAPFGWERLCDSSDQGVLTVMTCFSLSLEHLSAGIRTWRGVFALVMLQKVAIPSA